MDCYKMNPNPTSTAITERRRTMVQAILSAPTISVMAFPQGGGNSKKKNSGRSLSLRPCCLCYATEGGLITGDGVTFVRTMLSQVMVHLEEEENWTFCHFCKAQLQGLIRLKKKMDTIGDRVATMIVGLQSLFMSRPSPLTKEEDNDNVTNIRMEEESSGIFEGDFSQSQSHEQQCAQPNHDTSLDYQVAGLPYSETSSSSSSANLKQEDHVSDNQTSNALINDDFCLPTESSGCGDLSYTRLHLNLSSSRYLCSKCNYREARDYYLEHSRDTELQEDRKHNRLVSSQANQKLLVHQHNTHTRFELNLPNVPCDYCARSFTQTFDFRVKVRNHMKNVHGWLIQFCKVTQCTVWFDDCVEEMRRHMRQCHPKPPTLKE